MSRKAKINPPIAPNRNRALSTISHSANTPMSDHDDDSDQFPHEPISFRVPWSFSLSTA